MKRNNFLKKAVIFIMTAEARAVLRRRKPRVVAVTGSVGKTSAKEAVFACVKEAKNARKSEKSFNGDIGVPLAVLEKENAWRSPFGWIENIIGGFLEIFSPAKYPEILALEVGADRPKDISKMAGWLRPEVVVVTRLPDVPVHIEFFKDRASLIAEKASLILALKKGGLAVLNADDSDVLALAKTAEKVSAKVATFGKSALADFRFDEASLVYKESGKLAGVSFKVHSRNESSSVFIKDSVGENACYFAAAGFAVAGHFGISLADASASLEKNLVLPRGRMGLVAGIKDSTIIDDTYNSSPASAESSLRALLGAETRGRKIAILGDMLELGKFSHDAHAKIGEIASSCAEIIATVGLRARGIAESAMSFGFPESNLHQFENSREAGRFMQNLIAKDDIILVKGSQGMRMERTVEEIMAEPEKAEFLLVRQEKEWKER